MCQFFSLVSDGKGKIMFFDWELREQIFAGVSNYEADSHTSIADYYGYAGEKEDKLNKYEYDFLTGSFIIDQINAKNDDSAEIKRFCRKLDPKKIIPALIAKPIINPFNVKSYVKITNEDLWLLKKWNSVWNSVGNSVRNSVGDSVWNSVWNSVGNSVRNSVRDSVGDSVGDSVRNSVRNSVGDSVWDSVWDSVRNSVEAYISSFFDIKYRYDFSSCVKLWEKGLVPSFDGKVWRLHGKNGQILKEITVEELAKIKQTARK